MTEPPPESTPPPGAPPAGSRGRALPPDPAAYDHPRSAVARAKGLDAPYIAGGNDPEPERGRAEERRLLRLLIAMVVIVVLAGFVLGIIAQWLSGGG